MCKFSVVRQHNHLTLFSKCLFFVFLDYSYCMYAKCFCNFKEESGVSCCK